MQRTTSGVMGHRIALFVVLGVAAAACATSRSANVTSTSTLTSTEVRPKSNSIEERIAAAICVHEVECGRGQPETCIDAARSRTSRELATWTCDPDAAKAAAEECLERVRTAGCETDLAASEEGHVCALNGGCADIKTIHPGPEASEMAPPLR